MKEIRADGAVQYHKNQETITDLKKKNQQEIAAKKYYVCIQHPNIQILMDNNSKTERQTDRQTDRQRNNTCHAQQDHTNMPYIIIGCLRGQMCS